MNAGVLRAGAASAGTLDGDHAAGEGRAGARAGVELQDLSKRYGSLGAVRHVSLDVRHGEFLTLLGPSGSGKTTTLMMIAGFISPSSGRIRVAGRDVTDDPPHRRDIGMVYQSYALFPHLTVLKNVAFPLEVRKVARDRIQARAMEALDIVKLRDLADRYPAQLSGGQQQRVALARAIVFQPPLLLMDEPLGALDKKLREHMQLELMKIKRRLDVTVIYVTHDQEEALVMSDRVVVMADGVIQQVGAPRELYQRPANRFVADFIGDTNVVEGRVTSGGPVVTVSLAPGADIRAPANRAWSTGDRPYAVIRPECISIGAQAQRCANRLDGVVDQIIYVGDSSRYIVTLSNGQSVKVKRPNSGEPQAAEVGDRVTLGWDVDATWLVADSAPAAVG
jgi:putative spermidine/putrescine transport system ATP-binding protein